MREERRPPRRRGKKGKSIIAVLFSVIIICGALLLGVSVFFKISVIKVEGSTRYSSEQVLAVSGIQVGDNLFFVNKFDINSKIFKEFPYAQEVTINRGLPDTVRIKIIDAVPVAYIQEGNDYWLLDKSCKLLEKVGEDKISGLIKFLGIHPSQPVPGQKLSESEENKAKAAYLADIIAELSGRDMLSKVSQVDITDISSTYFDYLGRFKVKLGKNSDLPAKFKLLNDSITYLSPVATGTIDLTQDKEGRFISN